MLVAVLIVVVVVFVVAVVIVVAFVVVVVVVRVGFLIFGFADANFSHSIVTTNRVSKGFAASFNEAATTTWIKRF